MMTKENKVKSFFSNPLVGIIGSIASTIGLILAVVFYYNGKQERELVYFVNPVKSVLTSLQDESKFSIEYNNQKIEGNVSTAQLAFWNNGKESIRKENVLKQLHFQTANKTPILEVSLRKKSRDIVKIDIDRDSLHNGEFSVEWNILEFNDGGVLQIIYNSIPDTEILGDAIIEGQNKLRRLKSNKRILKPGEQYNPKSRNKEKYILIGLLLFMILYSSYKIRSRQKRNDQLFRSHDLMIVMNIILAIGAIVYITIFNSGMVEPPFGF